MNDPTTQRLYNEEKQATRDIIEEFRPLGLTILEASKAELKDINNYISLPHCGSVCLRNAATHEQNLKRYDQLQQLLSKILTDELEKSQNTRKDSIFSFNEGKFSVNQFYSHGLFKGSKDQSCLPGVPS